ncbi:MAG: hypothetical protein J2P44_14110, partial [Candidatus Dormibacteraeota bacterium]|nr:hypothetical protein [Candidatus Dormibacteraeota bacterium]
AARAAVQEGLAARDRAGLRVRQPLRSVTLTAQLGDEVQAIVADELNVKEVRQGAAFALDTELDRELRLEGLARDAVREVQQARKEAGLRIEDRIHLYWDGDGDWPAVWAAWSEWIAQETLARSVARRAGIESPRRRRLGLAVQVERAAPPAGQ